MTMINSELAEIAGIHAGDGYLRYTGKRKELDISGGYEERAYYDKHVIPLFNKTFGLSITGKYFPSRKTYGFCIRDKKVLDIMKSLGFPSGKKSTIVEIPKQVIKSNDKKIHCAFLRGLFDTDGCLTYDKKIHNASYFKKNYHYYPRIYLTTCSEFLAKETFRLTRNLGFKCRTYKKQPKIRTENLKFIHHIAGNKACEDWMRLIRPNNPCKVSRYLIWKKHGFCPPYTTYQERIYILKGQLNPKDLYKGP